MEDQNSNADDDNGEELTTKQMKIKAEVSFHIYAIHTQSINIHWYGLKS
jgi:hypothetical protein